MSGPASSTTREDSPRRGRPRPFAIAAVTAVAFAVRLWWVLAPPRVQLYSDAAGYDAAARRLLATGSYAFPIGRELWADAFHLDTASWSAYLHARPNAFAMPGYSAFLAALYRVTGSGSARIVGAQVAQALLGALTVGALFLLADALVGRRAAWVAAALAVVYPPNLWVAKYVLTETLFTFLLVVQVGALVWAARSRRLPAYAVAGALTALATYVRPVALLVPLLLAGLELVRALRSAERRAAVASALGRMALLAAVALLLLAPWAVRNARIYRAFVPLTSASAVARLHGLAFVAHAAAPPGTLAQNLELAPYAGDDHAWSAAEARNAVASLPPLTPADRLGVSPRALRLVLFALTSPFSVLYVAFGVGSWEFAMQVGLLALAAGGIAERRRDPITLVFLAGVPAYFVIAHSLTAMVMSRYLYPAMPFLIVLAAVALTGAAEALASLRPAKGTK